MKKLLFLLLILFPVTAFAIPETRVQKGVATNLTFTIRNSSSGVLISAATGLDCEIDLYSDSAAPDGFADLAGTETEIGATGVYYVALSAAETLTDYAIVQCKSTSTNAMTWLARLNTTLDGPRGTAQSVAAGTITLAAAESFGTNDLANNTSVYIRSASTGAGQTKCIASTSGDVMTLVSNWNTTPTGTITYDLISTPNCNGAIVAGGITTSSFAAGAIDAAAIAADAIGASELATDAIGAAELAADSITSAETAATFITEINDQVVDGLTTDTYAEMSSLPGSSPTISQMLQFVYQMARNRLTTTATTTTFYKNDGTTSLGTSTISDDGTTFIRGRLN